MFRVKNMVLKILRPRIIATYDDDYLTRINRAHVIFAIIVVADCFKILLTQLSVLMRE